MFVTKLIDKTEDVDFTGQKPFVFRPINQSICEVPLTKDLILASPFQFFSIEVEGRPITSLENGSFPINCISCYENAPDDYHFILLTHANGKDIVMYVNKDSSNNEGYASVLSIVKLYLDRLHDEKKGFVNGGTRARYKDRNGEKQVFRTNDVIYVAKTLNANSQTVTGQKIRHIKGWTVRSHWRKIKGLGVDRLGERTIEGYTWIASHVKGDEKMINAKVRKV